VLLPGPRLPVVPPQEPLRMRRGFLFVSAWLAKGQWALVWVGWFSPSGDDPLDAVLACHFDGQCDGQLMTAFERGFKEQPRRQEKFPDPGDPIKKRTRDKLHK
jgi:hypothetical protein